MLGGHLCIFIQLSFQNLFLFLTWVLLGFLSFSFSALTCPPTVSGEKSIVNFIGVPLYKSNFSLAALKIFF